MMLCCPNLPYLQLKFPIIPPVDGSHQSPFLPSLFLNQKMKDHNQGETAFNSLFQKNQNLFSSLGTFRYSVDRFLPWLVVFAWAIDSKANSQFVFHLLQILLANSSSCWWELVKVDWFDLLRFLPVLTIKPKFSQWSTHRKKCLMMKNVKLISSLMY